MGCPRTFAEAWIWFRVSWVLGSRTSETELPSPEDSSQGAVEGGHGGGEAAPRSASGHAGMDPHARECRAFSACVCVAVSVYLYVRCSSRSNLVDGAAGLCM